MIKVLQRSNDKDFVSRKTGPVFLKRVLLIKCAGFILRRASQLTLRDEEHGVSLSTSNIQLKRKRPFKKAPKLDDRHFDTLVADYNPRIGT